MSPIAPDPVLDAKAPGGPLAERWSKHKFELKLVNPANRRKFHVLVVGTGLAGASAMRGSGVCWLRRPARHAAACRPMPRPRRPPRR